MKAAERSQHPFTLKPKHWWSYLNPWWWKRKKIIEKVMAYQWEVYGLEGKIEIALKDAMLYGKGKVMVDWHDESKKG